MNSLSDRLKRVRILILDVDGVMTDGGILLASRDETKRFHVRDGSGVHFLRRSGVEVAFVTGRRSRLVARRARELGVREIHQKAHRKAPVVEALLERLGLAREEAAYMGDDLIDLPAMRRVGVSFAVADAVEEVRRSVDVVTEAPGGGGAVREAAEIILRAQGRWAGVMARYQETGTPENARVESVSAAQANAPGRKETPQ